MRKSTFKKTAYTVITFQRKKRWVQSIVNKPCQILTSMISPSRNISEGTTAIGIHQTNPIKGDHVTLLDVEKTLMQFVFG
jgi:hypothetical protein